jgi:hypothetical protein
MNSKKWMIKRCTSMIKHLKGGKEYAQHRQLELNPSEKNTKMKNDELEAREHLHEGSPDKNIEVKE